jgi:hypothetical protein
MLESFPISEFRRFCYNLDMLTHLNSALSTHAVSGVPGGHQVKVKTWYAAVALYNKLYCEGKIIRVLS